MNINYPENDYRNYLEHSHEGSVWKVHKYIDKIGKKYIYPVTSKATRGVRNLARKAYRETGSKGVVGIAKYGAQKFGETGLGKAAKKGGFKGVRAYTSVALDQARRNTGKKLTGLKKSATQYGRDAYRQTGVKGARGIAQYTFGKAKRGAQQLGAKAYASSSKLRTSLARLSPKNRERQEFRTYGRTLTKEERRKNRRRNLYKKYGWKVFKD